MKIGELRHRITIQESVASRDSFGAEILSWVDLAIVWAMVSPVSGKEYFAFQQINAEVSTKITMRYRPSITPKMRVLFENRVLEIDSIINPEQMNISLILMCKEVV